MRGRQVHLTMGVRELASDLSQNAKRQGKPVLRQLAITIAKRETPEPGTDSPSRLTRSRLFRKPETSDSQVLEVRVVDPVVGEDLHQDDAPANGNRNRSVRLGFNRRRSDSLQGSARVTAAPGQAVQFDLNPR